MSKSNYSSNRKQFRLKHALKWIALVIVAVTLSAVVCFTFGGLKFTNPLDKDINPDNLINVNTPGYIKSMKTGHGVEIDVDENGVIKLSGKATKAYSVTVATVTLDAGTYTISGIKNSESIDDFALRVDLPNGDAAWAGTENDTFTLTEAGNVTVVLQWANEYSFNFFTNNKVEPVLVKGEEVGSFYVD